MGFKKTVQGLQTDERRRHAGDAGHRNTRQSAVKVTITCDRPSNRLFVAFAIVFIYKKQVLTFPKKPGGR
jgi:hypothetical protein